MTKAQKDALVDGFDEGGTRYEVTKLGPDNYRVTAWQDGYVPCADVAALATTHGIAALTNRAVFA